MEDFDIISDTKAQDKCHNGKCLFDITKPSQYNPFQNKPIYYIQSDINKIKCDVELMKLDLKKILQKLSEREKSDLQESESHSTSWW